MNMPDEFPITASYPMPGEPDMDWTEPFLERGSTMSISGVLNSEPIPVEKAWVKDEVLYVQGKARWGNEQAS